MGRSKYIFVSGIVIVLFGCTNLKYLKKFNGYKNNPKTIKATMYAIQVSTIGDTLERAGSTYLFGFDQKGRTTVDQVFNEKGILLSYTDHAYDKFGNKILERGYTADSSLTFEKKQTFDSKGRLLESTLKNGNKVSHARTVYTKTDQGSESGSISDDGSYVIHRYDRNNNMVESLGFTKDSVPIYKMTYAYDGHGNQVMAKRYNERGQLQEIYAMEYDAQSNGTKTKSYEVSQKDTVLVGVNSTELIYDKYGNSIVEKYFLNDVPQAMVRLNITYWGK